MYPCLVKNRVIIYQYLGCIASDHRPTFALSTNGSQLEDPPTSLSWASVSGFSLPQTPYLFSSRQKNYHFKVLSVTKRPKAHTNITHGPEEPFVLSFYWIIAEEANGSYLFKILRGAGEGLLFHTRNLKRSSEQYLSTLPNKKTNVLSSNAHC